MNWIGGGLSRTRNNSNTKSVAAKQKAHYAKQHNRSLQGSQQRQPITIEIGTWKIQVDNTGRSESRSRPHEHRHFPSPVKSRASKMSRGHTVANMWPREIPSKRTRQQTKRPMTVGPSCSEALTVSSRFLPDPLALDASDEFDVKRRRLLEQDDWAGIKGPASNRGKMKFSDPKDKALIGRRRKISKKAHNLSPKARPLVMRDPDADPYVIDQYHSQGDLSFRIGSAVDRTEGGPTEANVIGRKHYSSVVSDEMLDDPHFSTPAPFAKRSTPALNTFTTHRPSNAHIQSASATKRSTARALSPILDEIARGQSSMVSPATSSEGSQGTEAVIEDSVWNLKYPENELKNFPVLTTPPNIKSIEKAKVEEPPTSSPSRFTHMSEINPFNAATYTADDVQRDFEQNSRGHAQLEEKIERGLVVLGRGSPCRTRNTLIPRSIIAVQNHPTPYPAEATHTPLLPNLDVAPTETTEAAEEAAWQETIFGKAEGDEDLFHDLFKSSSSPVPLAMQSQPSVLVEVDTSPIKQNPHIYEETPPRQSLIVAKMVVRKPPRYVGRNSHISPEPEVLGKRIPGGRRSAGGKGIVKALDQTKQKAESGGKRQWSKLPRRATEIGNRDGRKT